VGKSFGKNISFSNKIKGCGSTKHTRIIKKKMCERFIGSTFKKREGRGAFSFSSQVVLLFPILEKIWKRKRYQI